MAKVPIKLKIGDCVRVSLWFGVDGVVPTNRTKPVFSPMFDLSSPASQNHLLRVCTEARGRPALKVRPEGRCWIEIFKDNVIQAGFPFPVPAPLFSTALGVFFSKETFRNALGEQIGTSGDFWSGEFLFTKVNLWVETDDRPGKVTPADLVAEQVAWAGFMSEMNAVAAQGKGGGAAGMENGRAASSTWTAADAEQGLIDSTLQTWLLSNGAVLVIILLFTQNVLISVYTMLTIVLIVVALMGYLFAVAKFQFGAIEAVGVTIFVGMSVDYCLHIAHGYHTSNSRTRKDKSTEALTALGVSILGAALTTASASAFLFPCRIYLFVQLGVMITGNTVLAVFYALVFLVATLMVAGPTRVRPLLRRDWCDLMSVVLCDCVRPSMLRPRQPEQAGRGRVRRRSSSVYRQGKVEDEASGLSRDLGIEMTIVEEGEEDPEEGKEDAGKVIESYNPERTSRYQGGRTQGKMSLSLRLSI